jgi:hypothetical protein
MQASVPSLHSRTGRGIHGEGIARGPAGMTAPFAAILGLAVCCGLGLSAGRATAADEAAETPHIENPAEPAEGNVTYRLRELWRAGGEDEEIFFGSVAQVLADEDGDIYLLDTQLSEVQVYSPTGQHLRTLSREGDGPGEVRRPGDMFFLPTGELGLVQTFPGRVVLITRQGEPAGEIQLGGQDPAAGRFGVIAQGRCRGGNLVLLGMHMTWSPDGHMNQNFFASRYDRDGNELHRYLGKEYPLNLADFVMREEGMDFVWAGRLAVGPDGKVYEAPDRDAYAVNVHAPDGRLLRVIERQYKPWPRDEASRERARLDLEAIGHDYPTPPRETIVFDTEPAIVGMHVTGNGELWITNGSDVHDLPDGILASFDGFDAEGRFRHRVLLSGPGNLEQDALFLPAPDRAVLVTGAVEAYHAMQGVASNDAGDSTAGALEVICFAIEK